MDQSLINPNDFNLLFEERIVKNKADFTGEINLEDFMSLFNLLKIDMNKYDIIEIFNNFYKIGNNSIFFNDFLNSLKTKNPSMY